MTTEPINHRAHGHANTKAARAQCRREMAAFRKSIADEIREAHAAIVVGETVLAKLDDAGEREAVVVSIEPWGTGLRYNCRFASGWVYGTCKVRRA